MNFTKLAILTVLSIMNVAHASFNVSYPSIPVKVVSKDGLPLNNVSISYSVLAEKTQICRSDSIFDFGHPCLGSYILEETVGSAITNANGETRIPALNVSSLVSTGANPKLIINVSGNVVPFSVNPGKIMTCITSIPLGLVLVDNYPENKYVDTLSLDSETAKKYAAKSIVFKTYYDKVDMIQYYVEDSKLVMKKEYDQLDGMNRQSYLEAHHCK